MSSAKPKVAEKVGRPASGVTAFSSGEPIRGELLSPERLADRARELAGGSRILPKGSPGRRMLPRLEENARVLLACYRNVAQAIAHERPISPAAEWLADNWHIVQEQLREIRDDLPPSFYRELPKLADGPLAGFPRVTGIAWTFAEHTDSRIDIETLARFVEAYQTVQPLTIGELWAVAITLRLVLVENLRRLAEGIVRRRVEREEADALADAALAGPAEGLREKFRKATGRRFRGPFFVQLLARLRDRDPNRTPMLEWIDEALARAGETRDAIVAAEHHRQVAMHVSVRNVVTSMRLMSSVDWSDFFEKVSLVERALREGTNVAEMDFATRDRYRHAVEELSRGSGRTEIDIARRAAALARGSGERVGQRRADPGYYLISRGRAMLEKEVAYRPPLSQWLRRAWVSAATPGYMGTTTLLTLVILSAPLVMSAVGGAPTGVLIVLGILALVPASELATSVINRDITELVGPRRLPKLALEEGVPRELCTMVVVPTLLIDEDQIRIQAEQLEVRCLANSDGWVRFALLTDFRDADAETQPEDESLLAVARTAIEELNRRHGPGPGGEARFYLFHRRRVFDRSENKWLGWERKRGKLAEFNRLLRGARDTTFLDGGDPPPRNVRFVITLDADTRLPRRAVRALVGAMAHPLNRPVFDEREARVVEGHAVLQPRITATLPPIGHGTIFQRVFSGPRGIDPYAFAISDVYQDLFGEGIYTGKGIYDVDAFQRALVGRVPDDALLSHDLFEGLFTRAGLLSDVELFEEYPSHYEVAAARQHRWARGDWQLLPWLLPRVPDASGRRIPNPIPAIGRWKIADNLRRTLFAPAALATLFLAWILGEGGSLFWTFFVVATIAAPRLFPILAAAIPTRRKIAKRSLLRGIGADLVTAASQTILTLTLLPHQAGLMADAILRTLGRVLITRRKLLQWVTTAQAQAHYDLALRGFVRRIGPWAAAPAAACLYLVLSRVGASPEEAFFFVAWAVSPVVAWAITLPPADAERELPGRAEQLLLRATARRTWRFFEDFAKDEDNHLPPDNYQEDPRPVVAHRTSPTNIGLYLLSVTCAHDMGWIGATEMTERLEATFATLGRLERCRGHFLNWYDTRTLAPLEPRYVSTVDSGNLAGHLIALRHACLERANGPSPAETMLAGISDAVFLVKEAAGKAAPGRVRAAAGARKDLIAALAGFEPLLAPLADGETRTARLQKLARQQDALASAAAAAVAEEPGDGSEPLTDWIAAVRSAIDSHRRDDALPAGGAPPDGGPAVLPGDPALGAGGLAEIDPNASVRETGRRELDESEEQATPLARRLHGVARQAERYVDEMEFGFLYDPSQKLFSIGYRLSDGRLDTGYYDLLASEARLTSFLAIARGEVPPSHWFHLGRPLTPVARDSALISWSGSMFEYLMPDLVLDVPTGSLLEVTARLVVWRQIQYGAEHDVPWGVSESAYNGRDANLNYQYTNFGVSGLGLRRGLSEDLVIAPYATALAAMVNPSAASRNLRALARVGAAGRYGFYESIDYTRSRLPENATSAVVKAYMAHHQGMTLVALANVLTGWKARLRFHADPRVQATELLLQERTPRGVGVSRPLAGEVMTHLHVRGFVVPVLRRFQSPHDPTPRAHLLSNGRYSVMTTAAGAGYSRFLDLAVTRWREDPTRDCWGSWIYVRDLQAARIWSAGHQPSCVEPDSYEAAYFEDRVEIRRRDGALSTLMSIVVSPEDDAELRQVSVTNLGTRVRDVELTSYAEIVLNTPGADDAHPVFSNLFVETEFVEDLQALVATRRPRSASDERIWAAHLSVVEGFSPGPVEYESDRAAFLGRARDPRTAAAILDGTPLSGAVGAVLDPIFSLRRRVRLAPGSTARVTFTTLVAKTREALLAAADKYRDPAIFERTATLAWTAAQVQLRHLQISADEAHLFQRLATRILYSDPTLRAPAEALEKNTRGVSALWGYRISGDRPVVLVRMDQPEDRELFRGVLRAQEYWRLKGLLVDVVALNEEAPSYDPMLQTGLETILRTAGGQHGAQGHGDVFLLKADQVPRENQLALASIARIVLSARHGSLSDQALRFLKARPSLLPPLRPRPPSVPAEPSRIAKAEVAFGNGIGGFSEHAAEYVVSLERGETTPAPWVNVVANPTVGFVVSESGSGYTWSENSREHQLTPWSNDPVSDPVGEAIYLRDEATGEVWTPTALPIRDLEPYRCHHGQGWSRFEHETYGIATTLEQFVDADDPVKVSRLILENRSKRPRRISITAYVEWVLAAARSGSARLLVTWFDAESGAIFARNTGSLDFPGRVAFLALDEAPSGWTADRMEFLGRNGSAAAPSGLAPGVALSRRAGAALDPCAAMQSTLTLASGERVERRVFLGAAPDEATARRLVALHRGKDAGAGLQEVRLRWDAMLGAVHVRTPDPAFDAMTNRWLLYQALSCRIFGRSAFYQSSGAYGFRDQLQDALAFASARPQLLREQILRCAARQFVEGDVQHWWHPPSGKGVRTRMSDDLLWLPFAVTHYVDVTGDEEILDELVPFLEADPLRAGEEERFFVPAISSEKASLFEHCARAIDRSLTEGPHGLPLMGTGDWNDGMNRVGIGGRGESVWLAWFLSLNLRRFSEVAKKRGETRREKTWRDRIASLDRAVERDGWDGAWYRRAYFDDGTPLGSASNEECRIDSIAQSWGVISGAAPPDRAQRAMQAVDEELVRRDEGLVLLFTPPFDRSPHDPGYIKGYLPGVRENGGQYTHAAIWSVIAWAMLGDGDRAGEMFAMLNPIHHGGSPEGIGRYKVEPYAIAADVYAVAPHTGRGGWTWYTGSAGWMHRAAVEWILGLRRRGGVLLVDPCIPRGWSGFEATVRQGASRWEIRVANPAGVCRGVASLEVDGQSVDPAGGIVLKDDGQSHRVEVALGGGGRAVPPAP